MTQINRELLIDRKSPIPAYQQISADIAKRISQKEWHIDDKLPSEAELSKDYNVSRVTLRQAMATLERDSIIERFQGKGAFVKSNPRQIVQDLSFPSLDTAAAVNPLTSKILAIQPTTAPSHEIRHKLNVTENTPLTFVQRIFSHDDIPVGLNNIWFISEYIPNFSPAIIFENSISKTLYHVYKYNISSIDNYIESVKLDAIEASLLNSVYDASGLRISSQYLLEDSLAIEYSSTIWLSDAIRFHYVVSK